MKVKYNKKYQNETKSPQKKNKKQKTLSYFVLTTYSVSGKVLWGEQMQSNKKWPNLYLQHLFLLVNFMERCRRASGGEADLILEQYRWQTERKQSMKTRGVGQAGAWEGKDG